MRTIKESFLWLREKDRGGKKQILFVIKRKQKRFLLSEFLPSNFFDLFLVSMKNLKLAILIRWAFWSSILTMFWLSRTLFVVESCSRSLISILLISLIYPSILVFLWSRIRFRMSWLIVISLFCLNLICCSVYLIDINKMNYRLMNLLTISVMNNDRTQSSLSNSLEFYRCCRIRDDPPFDSVNERDFFLGFVHCRTSSDDWRELRSCEKLFLLMRILTGLIFLLDVFLLASISVFLLDLKSKLDQTSYSFNVRQTGKFL